MTCVKKTATTTTTSTTKRHQQSLARNGPLAGNGLTGGPSLASVVCRRPGQRSTGCQLAGPPASLSNPAGLGQARSGLHFHTLTPEHHERAGLGMAADPPRRHACASPTGRPNRRRQANGLCSTHFVRVCVCVCVERRNTSHGSESAWRAPAARLALSLELCRRPVSADWPERTSRPPPAGLTMYLSVSRLSI
jgi:hypothetical protein